MGIRSQNNPLASFFDVFANTGQETGPVVAGTGIEATGGVISEYTDGPSFYRAHTFTSSGTFTVTDLATGDLTNDVEYVVVGAGGGGGQYGGAGAGGYRSSVVGESSGGGNSAEPTLTVAVQSYPVVIGAGGAGSNGGDGENGNSTSFGPIISLGGGYGARYNFPGGVGGSGGAAGDVPRGGVIGTATNYPGPTAQGYPAGNGFSDQSGYTQGGGGGGAGAQGGGGPADSVPGTDAPGTPADGGNGIRTFIAGPADNSAGGVGTPGPASAGGVGGSPSTAVYGGWLAGGGGGGGHSPVSNNGGAGGGGQGGGPTVGGGGGNNGLQSTGGGAGSNDGVGGSGIVIVRYKIGTVENAKASGGSVSFYNNKTIHTFTSTGEFITPATFNETVQYVVIGGGGGGNFDGGGGGGAGAWLEGTTTISTPQTIVVTVGAGGNKGIENTTPGLAAYCVGNPSSFGTPLTAPGGGGSQFASPRHGGPGGSGAGGRGGSATGNGGPATGAPFPGTPGTASPPAGWGHNGGDAGPGAGGGGGGGAGGVGAATQASPKLEGHGGIGIQLHPDYRNPASAPTPTGGGLGYPGPNSEGYWLAGGGGGGSYPKGPEVGHGGGPGGPYAGAGRGQGDEAPGSYQDASANSGSGGGGSTAGAAPRSGGRGGSGIVLIAYPT